MKNQPNDIVTLEWLLPLFNQQLSQISDGWQLDADDTIYEQMIQPYHQVSGALTMIRLPLFAGLANKLSLLAEVSLNHHDSISMNNRRIGQFSHRLLQRELNQYARTSIYSTVLINNAIDELTQALSKLGIKTDSAISSSDTEQEQSKDMAIDNNIIDSIEATVPAGSVITNLTDHHYQQLLLAWRQQVQALLVVNTNQSSLLNVLERVSQYLWQTAQDENLQRLWYLTGLWLKDLAHNNTPLPEHYAPLLSQLDQVIETYAQQNELLPSTIKRLIIKVYIELDSLTKSSESTQSILSHLSQSAATSPHFLPRILNELETLVFNLDKPDTLLTPLEKIKSQLEGRGWTDYVTQVESVLADIERALLSETGFYTRTRAD